MPTTKRQTSMIRKGICFSGLSGNRNGILRLSALSLFAFLFWSVVTVAQEDTTTPPPPQPVQPDSLAILRARVDSFENLVKSLTAQSLLPKFRSLRATGGISRGVVAGGLVSLELTQPVLDKDPVVMLSGKAGDDETMSIAGLPLVIHNMTDTMLVVGVPDTLPRGSYELSVSVPDGDTLKPDLLRRPQILFVEPLINIIAWSLLPVAFLTFVIWLVTRHMKSPTGVRGLKLLFLEPENMTYSLSRAQFVLWAAAIAWGYMFLFFARGLVEDTWTFPPINGFIYTFLISLGTLVGAQATSASKGVKGAGQWNPSIADLMVHGGVIALERVQQILWTLIAIGIFLVTVVKNYASATILPEIPQELLILMGISSAGYLAGKAARKPGPIIQQVRISEGSLLINIVGDHLSRDAVLWVDGVQRSEKPTVVLSDQDDPNDFAKELQLKLEDSTTTGWFSAPHTLVLVNSDGQRCEWLTMPQIITVTVTNWVPSASTATDAGSADGGATPPGPVTLTIETEYLPSGATIEVTGATIIGTPTRDAQKPNMWTVQITPTNPGEKPFEEVRVPYGKSQAAVYTYKGQVPSSQSQAQSDPTVDSGLG